MENVDKGIFFVYTNWVHLQCLIGRFTYEQGMMLIGEVHRSGRYHPEYEEALKERNID